MKKEIIVNADDLESRVAILEDGQLSELHIEREPRIVGSIYKARVVSVLPGMDAAFADIGLDKNAFLCADDVGFVSETGVSASGLPRSLSISQRLKEGQEVVVQVVRAGVGGKGARVTTRLALPGRYLVLLLSDARQIGVSRRIEDRRERERLRKIGGQLRPPQDGIIMRTEAEGHRKRDLESDMRVLVNLRDRLRQKAAETKAPCLLHHDLALTYQVIRDAFTADVNSLVIDSKSAYDNAIELVQLIAPRLRKRVKRYRGKLPVFHKYGIEGEIDRLLRRRVWLRAGGYISIDEAEAFSAIDVNTGRYTGSTGLADTILRTNLEAAEEVARQLRLRDLGGIIVIDFIDMDRARHRQKVMKAFQEALARDRQKTKIVHLSPLGLVEMTRKRRGESLMGIITGTCPYCGGLGRVRRSLTIALKVEREIRRISAEAKPQAIVVSASPRVAAILVGEGGLRSVQLDKVVGRPVYIRADERMGPEQHEIVPMTLARATGTIRLHKKGSEVRVDHLEPGELDSNGRALGWSEGYRVEVQGPITGGESVAVVLAEAAHSFGRGYPKGMRPPPEAAQRKAADRPTAARRPRRRGKRRGQSAVSDAGQAKRQAAPSRDRARPQAGPAVAAAPASPPSVSTAPSPSVARVGLLRRGARRIARPRR